MGRWALPDLKSFLNETFRPRKLLAQKDAQLSALHGEWIDAHEAFQLSQEALAQSHAQLAQLREEWIKVHEAFRLSQEVLAQKDNQLAELREDWVKVHEAFRLSQEALSQKYSEVAELRNNWINVQEALRLSQGELTLKDTELAELRNNWLTAQETWRFSEEVLTQNKAGLATLRGDWTTPEGRAYRNGLSALRARFPWVGVFGAPKSASTFVWAALARLLNAGRLVFNIVHPDSRGIQLMHELDPARMRDRELQGRSIVFRMHVPASQYTLFHVRDLSIRAVVCTRDVFDCLVSLREELVKQWSQPEHMQVTREIGTHEVFIGTVPLQIIERFMGVDPDRQIDMVIELAALWYLRFYQSWRCAKERDPDLIHVCRFEHLTRESEAEMKDLMTFLNYPVDDAAVSAVISALRQDRAEANFNIGISGRGRQIMSGAQIDRVMSIARTVGAEDLLGGL